MRLYPTLFTVMFKGMDPERAHHLAFGVIKAMPLLGGLVRRLCEPHDSLKVHALGLEFPSPFGLAAGFDKNAEAIMGLGNLASVTLKWEQSPATHRRATRSRGCSASSMTVGSSTEWGSTTRAPRLQFPALNARE